MISAKVEKISFHTPSRSYAVILKDVVSEQKLSVVIGAYEAQSIALALEYMETPRPLTHDLIGAIIQNMKSGLLAIKITDLIDGVFYARMEIEGDNLGKVEVDARPSDAIAVALRMHAPILISEKVMKEAGFIESPADKEPDKEQISAEKSRKILEEKMQIAVAEEDYEKAAILRDKISALNS